MIIKLDHIQRLNLHALLGAQRTDVAGVRAIWALQDKLSLTTDEEGAISLKREIVGGHERTLWNPGLGLPPKDFDFTETEVARIGATIQTWDAFGVNADRAWLEPLLHYLQRQ